MALAPPELWDRVQALMLATPEILGTVNTWISSGKRHRCALVQWKPGSIHRALNQCDAVTIQTHVVVSPDQALLKGIQTTLLCTTSPIYRPRIPLIGLWYQSSVPVDGERTAQSYSIHYLNHISPRLGAILHDLREVGTTYYALEQMLGVLADSTQETPDHAMFAIFTCSFTTTESNKGKTPDLSGSYWWTRDDDNLNTREVCYGEEVISKFPLIDTPTLRALCWKYEFEIKGLTSGVCNMPAGVDLADAVNDVFLVLLYKCPPGPSPTDPDEYQP